MNNTTINWTDFSSNLIRARRKDNGKTGHFCTHKNDKCRNCYAEAINMRFGTGLAFHPANQDKIEFFFASHEAKNLRLMNARLAKKGEKKKVFLSSMTDLFHETMPFIYISEVFSLIEECQSLIFQTLTKRIDVAVDFFNKFPMYRNLENLWFGLTPEDDGSDIRQLLNIPARVRWLSLEPLLKPIDLAFYFFVCPDCGEAPKLDGKWRYNGEVYEHHHGYPIGHVRSVPIEGEFWFVVGGESGPRARATNIDHLRQVVFAGGLAGIPVWVKQLGKIPMMREKEWHERNPTRVLNYRGHKKVLDGFVPLAVTGKGENITEFPEDLQVRELPEISV